MTSRNRIPSAIDSYLQIPPESSLVLISGTLVCSANWLTTLFAGAFLSPKNRPDGNDGNGSGNHVILVSWMRDQQFWKDEIRRSSGHDVSRLAQQRQYAFLECSSASHVSDSGSSLGATEQAIKDIISKLSGNDSTVSIILDNPDVLLATQSATLQQLHLFVLRLRTLVHSMILSCSADFPMVSASVQGNGLSSPMEIDTAAFIAQEAHAARMVLSTRELSSGAAKDVSGVLRVTRGGNQCFGDSTGEMLEELEALYLVQRDGGVKVFGRGEGMT